MPMLYWMVCTLFYSIFECSIVIRLDRYSFLFVLLFLSYYIGAHSGKLLLPCPTLPAMAIYLYHHSIHPFIHHSLFIICIIFINSFLYKIKQIISVQPINREFYFVPKKEKRSIIISKQISGYFLN